MILFQQQFYEHYPTRSYLSTLDARTHFGMGTITHIDSLRIQWPDGKSQLLTNLQVNQAIYLAYQKDQEGKRPLLPLAKTPTALCEGIRVVRNKI